MILSTNDLSIYPPFSAGKKTQNKSKKKKKNTVPSTPSPHNTESPAALTHTHKKTDATIDRLQTVDPKKLSARIDLQTVRLGEGARCRGEEESAACERPRLCWDSKSVVLLHGACVRVCLSVFEVQKSLALSPSLTCCRRLLSQTPARNAAAWMRSGEPSDGACASPFYSNTPPFFPFSFPWSPALEKVEI